MFRAWAEAPGVQQARIGAGAKLNASEIAVEKDFWVCWTLRSRGNRATSARKAREAHAGSAFSPGGILVPGGLAK